MFSPLAWTSLQHMTVLSFLAAISADWWMVRLPEGNKVRWWEWCQGRWGGWCQRRWGWGGWCKGRWWGWCQGHQGWQIYANMCWIHKTLKEQCDCKGETRTYQSSGSLGTSWHQACSHFSILYDNYVKIYAKEDTRLYIFISLKSTWMPSRDETFRYPRNLDFRVSGLDKVVLEVI